MKAYCYSIYIVGKHYKGKITLSVYSSLVRNCNRIHNGLKYIFIRIIHGRRYIYRKPYNNEIINSSLGRIQVYHPSARSIAETADQHSCI